jgi:F-type H+-transporting ATPase subunit delta
MAGEATTIARPYADAAFKRAVESDKLGQWSDALGLLAAVVRDPAMAGLIANPKLSKTQLVELVFDIAGDKLDDEAKNLVKLMVESDRLIVMPAVAELFEAAKNAQQGTLDVQVTAAFPMDSAQETALADALKAKLGREVRITSEQDPELIGGVRIRAGDMVIDGSVRGQLAQLANELGI